MKALGLLLISLICLNSQAELVVFTDRPKDRFAKAAQLFTQKTGEEVVFVEAAYKDLLAKIESGDKSADLIVTKDLVYLTELQRKNLLMPMQKTAAVKSVYPFMRAENFDWVALSFRIRSAVFDPNRLTEAELSSYEDLSTEKWQGRLCLRTGKAAYNEALVSHLIATYGESRTRQIVAGWVKNLAAPVFPGDVQAIEAIANGVCDVAIVNHYYLAGELAKNPNLPVKVAFLNQSEEGVHSNGVGIGLTQFGGQADLAQEFIDILLSREIQLEFSAAHYDFPSIEGLAPSTFIKDWGPFKLSLKSWSTIGSQVGEARRVISESGYQ